MSLSKPGSSTHWPTAMTDDEFEREVEKRTGHPAVHNLHRRMDAQDKILLEVRDMLIAHIAEEKEQVRLEAPVTKALDELVLLWRASKILVPLLMICATTLWAFVQWWKDHVK